MSLILLRGISQASSGLNKLLVCFCNRFFLYYSLLVLSPSLLGLHRMAIRGSFNTSHCDCSKSKCTWQIERNNNKQIMQTNQQQIMLPADPTLFQSSCSCSSFLPTSALNCNRCPLSFWPSLFALADGFHLDPEPVWRFLLRLWL